MPSAATQRDNLTVAGAGPSGSLAGLLLDAALARPDHAAFRDGAGRAEWCDRPPLELSNAISAEAVRRLSDFFLSLGLDDGAAIGIWLPNGSEAALSILAAGHAGLTPCLLDPTCSAGELSSAIEAADLRALVTQTRVGADRLAQKACFVAAGFFRLRFLLAFGPSVPDGVIDLDPVLLTPRSTERRLAVPAATSPGLITFSWSAGAPVPIRRSCPALIAGAGLLLRETKIRPDDRLVTFMSPDDVKAIGTGLVAALLTGATLECHGVFSGEGLLQALASKQPAHLVVPGFLEDALAEAGTPEACATTLLLHEAPVELAGRHPAGERVVDVIGFGEMGYLPTARARSDGMATELAVGKTCGLPALFEALVNDEHEICFRGSAAVAQDGSTLPVERWRPSGYKVEVAGNHLTRVSSTAR